MSSSSRQILFISHATPEDNAFTSWLGARLSSAGYEVWSDITKLIGGEVFWNDVEVAIRQHSIKFLSVLSPAAPAKRGWQKELSVADAVEGRAGLGDFIVPLRAGNVPYADIPILIHNKNVIDFTAGWHLGLARLLEKLQKDSVPCRHDGVEEAVSDWARNFLEFDRGKAVQDEEVMSNALPIEALPATIRISVFSLTPQDIAPLQNQWPCSLVGSHLVSFARASEFDTPADVSSLRKDVEIDTAEFLRAGAASLSQLSYSDRSNIVTDLLRQAWELHAASAGLIGFTFANGQVGWYLPLPSQTKIERVRFKDALGKLGSRALLGESKKLKAFWHLAMEWAPVVGRQHRYSLRTHVVFTSDGQKPIGEAAAMHRLRRRFCRSWWQDRWRDLISAHLAHVCKGLPRLSLVVAPNRGVVVGTSPQTYTAPVTTIAREQAAAAIDDLHDDPDLLYDESADDEFTDEDDADEEDGPE